MDGWMLIVYPLFLDYDGVTGLNSVHLDQWSQTHRPVATRAQALISKAAVPSSASFHLRQNSRPL